MDELKRFRNTFFHSAWELWVHTPDHHFDRIHPDAQSLLSWDDVRDASAAVGELRVKVDPLPRRRLGHDVDVDLQKEKRMKKLQCLTVVLTGFTAIRRLLRSSVQRLTFSPVRVTMSRGPYMKRPVTVCAPSSVKTASFTRWLAVTFCGSDGNKRIGLS